MDPTQVLDNYLIASRKRPVLEQALQQAPAAFVEALQRHAVKRYANNTLTLAELKVFAHDLASVCGKPVAQRLYLAIASTNPCCVRTANIEARARLEEWLLA